MICPKCNRPLEEQAQFCSFCGMKVADSVPAPQAQMELTKIVPAPLRSTIGKYSANDVLLQLSKVVFTFLAIWLIYGIAEFLFTS